MGGATSTNHFLNGLIFAGDVLQQKAKSFDEAGGMYESLNYANFGIQEALLFRIAWINTHPGQNPVIFLNWQNCRVTSHKSAIRVQVCCIV